MSNELKILSIHMEYQKNKYIQLGEAYKNMRGFMHDTKKHLFIIENLLQQKKYDEIIPYAQNMSDDLESRYCTINTGNLVIDAFISNLALQTKNNNITLLTNLALDTSLIPVNDYHLAIILGNLIDNAFNACLHQIGANITVKIQTIEDVFSIHITNTYLPDADTNSYSKKNVDDLVHGYGLKNVENIIAMYNGIFHTDIENNTYAVTVVIPSHVNIPT